MNSNSIISLTDARLNWSDDCNDMSIREAIGEAIGAGYTICKYADPVDGARSGLTEDEAIEIAGVDASLLYLTMGA